MTTTPALSPRPWLPPHVQTRIAEISARVATADASPVNATIDALITKNHNIHDRDCINLNPATNVMNPRAEAMLSAGLGSRPSLGYPGDKYEMGLEAIEEIEVIAAYTPAHVHCDRQPPTDEPLQETVPGLDPAMQLLLNDGPCGELILVRASFIASTPALHLSAMPSLAERLRTSRTFLIADSHRASS